MPPYLPQTDFHIVTLFLIMGLEELYQALEQAVVVELRDEAPVEVSDGPGECHNRHEGRHIVMVNPPRQHTRAIDF